MMDFVDKNITELKPVKALSLEGTPFKLVEEVNDLKDLAAKLCSVEEFAVNFFLCFFFCFLVQCAMHCWNVTLFGRSCKKCDYVMSSGHSTIGSFLKLK